MAGIGNYSKGEKFALKSGNNTSFKMMGSNENKKEYKAPSPEEQIRLAKIASEKSGKDLRYDARLSKIDGAHRFS